MNVGELLKNLFKLHVVGVIGLELELYRLEK